MKIANSLFALVSSSIALATALDLSNSQWIWTNELPGPGGDAPIGLRAFRRFIPTPQGVTPVLANVLIAVDGGYHLFINGKEVGKDGNYHIAQSYCVSLVSPCGTLVAVTASNGGTVPNPAGVLTAIEITFSDGSTQTVVSDAAWNALNNSDIPTNYNLFSFDDSSWPKAVTEGISGSPPWGVTTLPSNTSCSSANS